MVHLSIGHKSMSESLDPIQDYAAVYQELADVVVPTVPGLYEDCGGDKWLLTGDGFWIDKDGITEETKYNWMMFAVAPLTLVEDV